MHRARPAYLVAPSVPAQAGACESALRIVSRLVHRPRCISWRPRRSELGSEKKWLARSFPPSLGGTVRPLNLEPGCFADRSRVRARGRYCLQRFVNFRFSRNDRRLTSPAVWCPSSPRSFSLCFLSSVRFLALHCLIIANLQLAILLCWMVGDAPSRLRFPLL